MSGKEQMMLGLVAHADLLECNKYTYKQEYRDNTHTQND